MSAKEHNNPFNVGSWKSPRALQIQSRHPGLTSANSDPKVGLNHPVVCPEEGGPTHWPSNQSQLGEHILLQDCSAFVKQYLRQLNCPGKWARRGPCLLCLV